MVLYIIPLIASARPSLNHVVILNNVGLTAGLAKNTLFVFSCYYFAFSYGAWPANLATIKSYTRDKRSVDRVYLSALEVCSRQSAIQIHVWAYLTLPGQICHLVLHISVFVERPHAFCGNNFYVSGLTTGQDYTLVFNLHKTIRFVSATTEATLSP